MPTTTVSEVLNEYSEISRIVKRLKRRNAISKTNERKFETLKKRMIKLYKRLLPNSDPELIRWLAK